jgi:hypothetical protein
VNVLNLNQSRSPIVLFLSFLWTGLMDILMSKASKRLSLSSKKNKARKTRQGIVPTATRDDVNTLLKVVEIYDTSYDFEAAE